ncbi:MAG TPA: 2-oxoacid:acceptor oxidoreductase family protein [Bryobacteraceae bacterium]|nr:2-oxoacid:acceptor oxidoreductase family protein [Bryobacteraceae bacterium]
MKEIILAGFGGQGVLTGGLVIAQMAADRDLHTVWMPAYGPTMRGGKANCVVKYEEAAGGRVGSPIMEEADALIAMNEPSLDYLACCKPGATVIVNAHSVPETRTYPEGVKVVRLDCVELADKLDNPKGQSLVMLGALIKSVGLFDREYARESLLGFFEHKGKEKFAALNAAAFDAGYDAV